MVKIFVRERRHVGKGDGRPRLAVVGVEGSDLKFFRTRIRQAELEAIAQAIQAEVVMLPRGSGENYSESGTGGRRRRRQEYQD